MDTALFEGTLVESERILYTPSTFARTNLIHLQECGRLKALSPHTSHRENLYFLNLCQTFSLFLLTIFQEMAHSE